MEPILSKAIAEAHRTFHSLGSQEQAFQQLSAAAIAALRSGGKILTCGNGGSAADAMHLAEELVGKYKASRRSLAAICLNADPTLLTCIGNDFGFDEIFARQIESLAKENDVLICFSTSGNSPNILRALAVARAKHVKSAALLGKGGGQARAKADIEMIVESNDSGRVQEAHTLILHALLEAIECELTA